MVYRLSERIPIPAVEDKKHIRTELEHTLRLDGFEVYPAEDGATGFRRGG